MSNDGRDDAEERSWPIPDGVPGECDVVICSSQAAWEQFVTLEGGDEAILALCHWHSFELHKLDQRADPSDPVFARHYRCPRCGAGVERREGKIDDGSSGSYYTCAGDCALGWLAEDLYDDAYERLYAAWEAELRPPSEEE
jgi:hypothetical protein